jgi:integrase
MARIKQRGDSWRAEVATKNRATGELHRENQSFETERQAKDWAQALESDLKRAQHSDQRIIDSTPLAGLIQRYISEVSVKKLGASQEITRLNKWLAHPLANRPLSKCLPVDFANYIAKRRKDISKRGGPVSEQTIKHEIIVISNVFESARKDWGYQIQNPTKQISKPGGSQSRDIRIGDKLPDLLNELSKRRNKQYPIIVEFAIETGMRQDEIMRAAWRDIDKTQQIIEVLGKDTRTRTGQRKKRIVPLSPRAIQILSSLPQAINSNTLIFQTAGKASADGLSRAFTAACKTVGIDGGCFHITRHEAASRLAPFYQQAELTKFMGWTSPAMAARYYHPDAVSLHAGLQRMQLAKQK